MHHSGVYFRWISLDQIFLTSEGRLMMGGLTGAVNASNTSQTVKERDREREKEKEREIKREGMKEKEKEKEKGKGKERHVGRDEDGDNDGDGDEELDAGGESVMKVLHYFYLHIST